MSSTYLMDQGIVYWQKGTALEKEEKYKEAIDAYKSGCELMLKWLEYDKVPKRVTELKKKCVMYMDHIDELKGVHTKKQKVAQGGGGNAGGNDDDLDADQKALQAMISQCVIKVVPDVTFADVAGLETAKSALTEAVILPRLMPHLFVGDRKPWRAILLYGVPGTGKTFIAKALAAECKATFFAVSSSDLISKYVGESERLVRALFEMARKETAAVVFIDEIDSLCSARGAEGENESSKRVKTEFLVQMQGVGKDNDHVLILGATNYPENLDPAVRRRFERRIEITLPEWPARLQILKQAMAKTDNNVTEEQLASLENPTNMFSASDLSVLMKDAVMQPVRELQAARAFLEASDGKFRPCAPGTPGCIEATLLDLAKEKGGDAVAVPPVSIKHVLKAIQTCKKSVSKADITRINKFTQEFGQEG